MRALCSIKGKHLYINPFLESKSHEQYFVKQWYNTQTGYVYNGLTIIISNEDNSFTEIVDVDTLWLY